MAKDIHLENGTTYKFPYQFELSSKGDKHELVITPTLQVPIRKAEADQMRLLEAARIHAIASAYGVRALRLVMEVLGLQQRAASRLLRKRVSRACSMTRRPAMNSSDPYRFRQGTRQPIALLGGHDHPRVRTPCAAEPVK